MIHDISKSEAILWLENSVLGDQLHIKKIIIKDRVYNHDFPNLTKAKKSETENIPADEKVFGDLFY